MVKRDWRSGVKAYHLPLEIQAHLHCQNPGKHTKLIQSEWPPFLVEYFIWEPLLSIVQLEKSFQNALVVTASFLYRLFVSDEVGHRGSTANCSCDEVDL